MTERVLGPTGTAAKVAALLHRSACSSRHSCSSSRSVAVRANVLPGSHFEIDDPAGTVGANLIVDASPGTLDWDVVAQNRRADLPTGANDDSYRGGVKEDTECPGEVDRLDPNNKSDLLEFGGYFEAEAAGPGFLHVYWARVNDPSGTTNMDFEFNRSTQACSEGPNVVRTVGDVLLQFDVDQGGAQAELSRRTWLASGQWSEATALGTSEAIGAINQVSIPAAESDGLISSGSLAPRTFGEASFDLSAVSGERQLRRLRLSDAQVPQLRQLHVAAQGLHPSDLDRHPTTAVRSRSRRRASTRLPGAERSPHAGVVFAVWRCLHGHDRRQR